MRSCKSEFWKNVFEIELDYILRKLNGTENVLSVGCGPAIIETGLAEHGFDVTGLDISEEALGQAPNGIRTIIGSAEQMSFSDSSFDAAIYVASLQFIEKYKEAVKETFRCLKSGGKVLIMLLNPESEFFKEKMRNPDSYVSRIKHIGLKDIEETVAEYFSVETEYLLGIKGTKTFQSSDPDVASLYVIKGIKK